MHVMVTGSAGKIGREAVRALKVAGHKVTGIDLKGGIVDGVRTVKVDCADFGEVMGAFSGVDTISKPDAVVHLAGIPMPGLASDADIFQVNTLSTYNVFSACTRLGICRVIWASSETILGLPFTTPPTYLPLDEDAPDLPNWSYSLSKHLGEAMAEQFVRWHPQMTIASLRFSNVFDAADYAQRDAIEARPEGRKLNLWAYVDARDCGEACRLAVEADLSGHQRMIIAAADSVVSVPSAELAARYFPETPIRDGLEGNASFLSSSRARDLIGYRPQYGWRER